MITADLCLQLGGFSRLRWFGPKAIEANLSAGLAERDKWHAPEVHKNEFHLASDVYNWATTTYYVRSTKLY